MADRDVKPIRRVVRHAPASVAPGEGQPSVPAGRSAPEPITPAAEPATPAAEPARADPPAAPATEAGPAAAPAAEPVTPAAAPAAPVEPSGPDSPYGFPTEALLADHVAAAEELRADVERLRRELDAPPPPRPVRRRRSRKPLLGVLVVGGTLGLIATATLIPWSEPGSSPSPSGPVAVAARPGAVPALSPRIAQGLPATGPGIDRPGTMQVVTVADDGTLDVTEQAVLGPRGLRDLNLRLPSMAALGGAVAELSPAVHDLRVAVNGTAVTPLPTADGPGWVVTAADGSRARTVRLSYRVTDAVVRSRPSDAGRALGVSLPLLGEALRQQGLPLVVRTVGRGIGGVTCPSAPVQKMLCGEEVDGGWLATVPAEAASPALLIQLNLS